MCALLDLFRAATSPSSGHEVEDLDLPTAIQKVGIREFRAGLADYIASDVPIAITKHGQTVGFFIPAHADRTADVAALKSAAAKLDRLLDLSESDIDVIVEEFADLREAATWWGRNGGSLWMPTS